MSQRSETRNIQEYFHDIVSELRKLMAESRNESFHLTSLMQYLILFLSKIN